MNILSCNIKSSIRKKLSKKFDIIKARLRYYRDCIINKRLYLHREVIFNVILCGDAYGQYAVVPQLLPKNPICLCFGIGEDVTFELEIMKRYNAIIYAFDPTPRAIEYVQQSVSDKNFVFFPYGLNIEDGRREFCIFEDSNPEPSGNILDDATIEIRDKTITVDMLSFESVMRILKNEITIPCVVSNKAGFSDQIDILKLDIEGTEFSVLPGILDSGYAPTQILVEFHEKFYKNGKNRLKLVYEKLKEHGYKIVYLSPNRKEVTFVKTLGV